MSWSLMLLFQLLAGSIGEAPAWKRERKKRVSRLHPVASKETFIVSCFAIYRLCCLMNRVLRLLIASSSSSRDVYSCH
ncbi:hypothetical protein K449DRAFT_386505 [Hypoxylon sp. EC38]|nr:hypothetical protein K449DRAFT_386505 [Hypoxylon sp. EC38]